MVLLLMYEAQAATISILTERLHFETASQLAFFLCFIRPLISLFYNYYSIIVTDISSDISTERRSG